MQPLGFIHAPTNLGPSLYPEGRERRPDKLPLALAQAGLPAAIGATEKTALSRLPYPDHDVTLLDPDGDSQRVLSGVICQAFANFARTSPL